MTPLNPLALLPLVVLAGSAVGVMLATAFHRNRGVAAGLTAIGLAVTFVTLPMVSETPARQVTALLLLDNFALFYVGLIVAASFAVALMSYGYLERVGGRNEEFYVLLLCATLGASVLAASTHFVSFFLGLEILSVSLYALIAYPRARNVSIEAALKYLVLAAGSAAFLLFGMALVYAELGTMDFARIAAQRAALAPVDTLILLTGSALMLVGMGFKLAVAPFHWWTPDVYEGAPAPVTAFVATVSKGAMFAVLLRYFSQVDMHTYPSLFLAFTVIAIASMFVGNLLALLQHNVKRILAYSSIAHLGYLLVAFLASGPLAATAAAFYLVSYFITTLGGFGVITFLSAGDRDADEMEDYRGLFWRRPGIAAVFTAMLLSLAGMPLTAGFIGKFYVLAAGEQSARWLAVLALVVNSAIGLFYYLRIVVAMSAPVRNDREERTAHAHAVSLSWPNAGLLACLTLALLWIGVYPSGLIRVVQALVTAPAVLP
jgi:NADH-quinone oxidoreductase subunit N